MKRPRSTYYYRSRRAAARETALRERIVTLCDEFSRYGYRRVTHQLRAEGMSINHKAVARIMRENGLQVRPFRRFVRTTDSDYDSPISPNLAANLVPDGPNQLWVADLSYVAIAVNFCLCGSDSRRMVKAGGRLRYLTEDRYSSGAGRLAAAVETRRPSPGCIHHSDRGGQYAADLYRKALADFGLRGPWADVELLMTIPRPRAS